MTKATATQEMTVDQLAARAGSLSSTVRMYQLRGLLPPPRREGRNAYYGPAHLERLALIGRLQGQGFSLAAIKQLVDAWNEGTALPEVLGLRDYGSSPVRLRATDLFERFAGVSISAALLRRAADAGLLTLHDDATVTVSDERFVAVGSELAAMGIPLERIVDEWTELRRLTDAIANRFGALFAEEVWPRMTTEGRDPARLLSDATVAFDRLAPLARTIVASALDESMRSTVGDFVETEQRRAATKRRARSRSSTPRATRAPGRRAT